jgi:hypothetical protein
MAVVTIWEKEIGTNKLLKKPDSLSTSFDYTVDELIGLQKSPTEIDSYQFEFLTTDDTWSMNPEIKIDNLDKDMTITAWYALVGPNKNSYATVWAFSLDTGDFIPNANAIDSVNPIPNDWPDPTTPNIPPKKWTGGPIVPTTEKFDIKLKHELSSQFFVDWYRLNKTSSTADKSDVISINKDESVWIIARYSNKRQLRVIPDLTAIPDWRKWTLEEFGGLGGDWSLWKSNAEVIGRIIEENKLKPLTMEEEKAYFRLRLPTNEKSGDLRAMEKTDIKALHLHYKSRVYVVNEKQWNAFMDAALVKVKNKIGAAKSLTFQELSKYEI